MRERRSRDRRRARRAPAAGRPATSSPRRKALLEWIARRPLHVPRLPRVRARSARTARTCSRRCPARGSASCASRRAPVSRSFAQLPPEVRRLARAPTLLNLTKANSRATVHRPAYLDYVGVKRFDDAGEVVGERRFLGLFTSTAYSASPSEIPVLRRKVSAVVERSGPAAGQPRPQGAGRDPRDYPRDELFQIAEDELFEIALGILHLGERRQRAALRPPRRVRPLRLVPRLPPARALQHRRPARRSQEILREAFGGASVDYTARVSESVLARLHFVVHTTPGDAARRTTSPRSRRGSPRPRARGATTSATRSSSSSARSARRARSRATRDAFPAAYRDDFTPRRRVADIERIERLDPRTTSAMSLYAPARVGAPASSRSSSSALGRADPALGRAAAAREHGRRVTDERRTRCSRSDGRPVWIYDFGLEYDDGAELQTRSTCARSSRTRSRASGAATPRTTASTGSSSRRGSTWREVALLRAIAQVPAPGREHVQPGVHGGRARRAPRHRPPARRARSSSASTRRGPSDADAAGASARASEHRAALDGVASLDEDRILRSFLDVVQATLRTNYFQTDAGRAGRSRTSSFKLDPDADPGSARAAADVRDLRLLAAGRGRAPARRQGRARRHPLVGPARGLPHRGPRADEGADGQERRDRAGGREGRLRRQAAAGRRRPSALLDGGRRVLPHLHPRPARHHRQRSSAGEVVPAARRRPLRRRRPVPRRRGRQGHRDVLRHRQRDLGASTASGSATRSRRAARPATTTRRWGSPPAAPGSRCKRHFRELGIDVAERPTSPWSGSATCPATCSATGCCSRAHIKLVGAFDHRHVFLDPDPDPEQSFARARAPLRAAGLVLGRLRRGADLAGRRRLPAHRQVDPALARGARRRSASRPSR